MGIRAERNQTIQKYILDQVRQHPQDVVRLVAEQFGLSREGAHKHFRALIEAGQILAIGQTRNRRYMLVPIQKTEKTFVLNGSVREDVVWRADVAPLLANVPFNVLDICHYGFTEMFNNALEHSEGREVRIKIVVWWDQIEMIVMDDGVGIFHKLQRDLHLDDPLHAILELLKGKLTTDKKHHSGQGIFYTTRAFDTFAMLSDRYQFLHNDTGFDFWNEAEGAGCAEMQGTRVTMAISTRSERTQLELFRRFSTEEGDYAFDKTVVPVYLARYGSENLVSRSQARRLLARFECFRHVVLDFARVEMIGQAFADEVFRVFQLEHPQVLLRYINASSDVEKMIRGVGALGN